LKNIKIYSLKKISQRKYTRKIGIFQKMCLIKKKAGIKSCLFKIYKNKFILKD